MEITYTLEELPKAALKFIENIGSHRVFLFDGEMGAGKTTFISEVCRQLGASDHLGSPTFSIINEYTDINGEPIYHFDLYRIENPQEILDIGAEDYFYSGNLCFVEWPDRLRELTPPNALHVSLSILPNSSRQITF